MAQELLGDRHTSDNDEEAKSAQALANIKRLNTDTILENVYRD